MTKRVASSERESSSPSSIGKVARALFVDAPERLIDLVEQQARRIEEQDQQISALQGHITELEERFEQLERSSKRSAAPFARADDKRKKDKKKPGRKAGHRGQHRKRPSDAAINRHVDVGLSHCPHCGALLDKAGEKAIEQTIIEAPSVKPEVIRLITYRNHCHGCDKKVASNHPLQVSTASGAAGTHLGPRALAIAASLNKGLGLTLRRTCQALRQLLGIELTAGGLSQALARMAGRLEPDYQALLHEVKSQPALYTDETSWWVGGPGYSLWVLTNDAGTCYRVVSSRSRAEAEALIGSDFAGVLVSDCLNIYDDLTFRQHKCYAHHLKAIGQALDRPTAKGSAYLRELRSLLQGAMVLKIMKADLPVAVVRRMRKALEDNACRLLSQQPASGPGHDPGDEAQRRHEEKLRQRLAKQQDHLFTFLDHDEVEATNNRAERQLRPAVISRKISCGNKTENGARTWETLASLAATCQQKHLSFIDLVAQKMPLAISPTPAR
jgi:transposase